MADGSVGIMGLPRNVSPRKQINYIPYEEGLNRKQQKPFDKTIFILNLLHKLIFQFFLFT